MRIEEEKAARAKQEKAHRMLQQVEIANQLNLTMKQSQKQREREEDDAIYKYVQDKQQREFEHQMEEKRIKDEKEREV